MSLITRAKELNELGFAVVPVSEQKIPLVKGWSQFAAADQKGKLDGIIGEAPKLAMVIPQGYEVLDIDSKNCLNGDLNKRFVAMLRMYDPNLYSKLVLQTTVNGGLHFIYATNRSMPSRKLASRTATDKEAKKGVRGVVLIETRGVGGMVVVAPSDGYMLVNNSFSRIPFITDSEHELLVSISKAFHERSKASISPSEAKLHVSGNNKPSWTDYNEKSDYITTLTTLERAGWAVCKESGENIYLTRPNKKDGISADIHKTHNIFKAWTTNSNFDSDKWYDSFGVLTICEYGGDFSLAAVDLLKKGFGEHFSENQMLEKEIDEFELICKEIYAKQFDYDANVVFPDPIMYIEGMGNRYRSAYKGSMVGVVGREKSMKTTVVKGMVASALDEGKNHLNFRTYIEPKKKILWFETEQPTDRWQKGIKEIFLMAGIKTNIKDRFKSFSLRKYPVHIRRKALMHIISREKDVGMVIIDGIVDLCENFLDNVVSGELVSELLTVCDNDIMLVYLLHLTKSAGFMRGSLGTELANKSDLVIKTESDEEDAGIAKVSCLLSREMRFPSYDITRDPSTGVPFLYDSDKSEPVLPPRDKEMDMPF